jgi:hypothetical protein
MKLLFYQMKVVVSLTSIPSHFDKLEPILERLTQQTCHEVWVNIPRVYTRFPDWDGKVPPLWFKIEGEP